MMTTIYGILDINTLNNTLHTLSCDNIDDQINKFNIDSKETPLMYACHRGVAPIIKRLINYGADVNLANEEGITPLMKAVISGSLECVEILIAFGADIYVKSVFGITALMLTHTNKNEAIAEYLLVVGCSTAKSRTYVNERDMYGGSALFKSVTIGNLLCVKIFLKYGADVNVKTTLGITPLMMASRHNRFDIQSLLCKYGANINDTDYRQHSALMYACKSNNPVCAIYLVRRGCLIDIYWLKRSRIWLSLEQYIEQ